MAPTEANSPDDLEKLLIFSYQTFRRIAKNYSEQFAQFHPGRSSNSILCNSKSTATTTKPCIKVVLVIISLTEYGVNKIPFRIHQ